MQTATFGDADLIAATGTAESLDAMVDRLGCLPAAPLSMPKQRLEMPRRGLLGVLAALPRLAPGAARRSGR